MKILPKKNIFTHKGQQEPQDTSTTADVLAVWGSPGSGKTVTAVKIAKYLSRKGHNVVLVLCDMTAPMLSCICPSSSVETTPSLGSVLAATHVTTSLVKHNLITLKKDNHLTILGLQKGENEYTYPPYSQTQADELMACLREVAPYIVMDCSSYLANDTLSATALSASDCALQVVNADLKSIGYLSSQLPLLHEGGLDQECLYKVASNVKPQQAIEQLTAALGSLAFTLPHSQELEQQCLDGNLLVDLQLKDSRQYRREIAKLCQEVFGC